MSVDEELLARQSTSNSSLSDAENASRRAGDLREAKRAEDFTDSGEPMDLRSAVMEEKRKKDTEQKAKGDQEEDKAQSAGNSMKLKQSIINIFTSFGLSFFYVIFHFFASHFNKKRYAPLGSEWFDAPGMTVRQRDELGGNIAILEKPAFGCGLLLVFIVAFIALAPVFLIFYVISDPSNILAMPALIFKAIKSIL